MNVKTRPFLSNPSDLPPRSLAEAIREADERILLLRMLAPFGRARPFVILVASLLPLVFGIVPGSALADSIVPWLARGGICLIILIIVGGLYRTVRSILDFADDIGSLLRDRRDEQLLIRELDSFFGTIRSQVTWSVSMVVFAGAILYQGLLPHSGGPGDYATLSLLTFVVCSSLLWCWRFADFAGRIARADLEFGELDPAEEYALKRLKRILRLAIAAISIELICTGVVAWSLQVDPVRFPGSDPWPTGVLALQLTGLIIMIALLTRFSWALVQLNRSIKKEEQLRIADLRRKRDAIKRGSASPEALRLRLGYENDLKRLRRSPWGSVFDVTLAVLGPLVPLAVQVYMFSRL